MGEDHTQRNSGEAPRVSIIIAAYNSERFLAQTIRSIREQTFRDWECVIVDDGSTDGTPEIARRLAAEDPRVCVATQPNAGASAARNMGMTLIHPGSKYLTFMDSDDLWAPEALEVLCDEADHHPERVGVHAVAKCIDQDGNPFEDPMYTWRGSGRIVYDKFGNVVKLDPSTPTNFQSLWFSNPFPPGLVLGRRTVYEKVGEWDMGLYPVEDWEMLLRLCRHGDLHFVDRVLLSYRRHSNNSSGRSDEVNVRKIRNMFYKTYFSRENDVKHRQILRKNWRAAQLFDLREKLRVAGEQLGKARFASAASTVARGCLSLYRYARGYPTLEGI
ncbi:MAG: glycosyltransferase [Chthoniobacteraceae bacterium]